MEKDRRFEVIYRTEIFTNNARDAALQAEDILNNMIFRPCFEVREIGKNSPILIIDLNKE